jgi:hypothetical protein
LETLNNFQNLDKPEESQLCIFASALKKYETDDFLEIDQFIINRLMYFLSLNTQSIWKEQVSKTFGFLNNKEDIL